MKNTDLMEYGRGHFRLKDPVSVASRCLSNGNVSADRASLPIPQCVIRKIQVSTKISGILSETLPIVETCYQLSSTKVSGSFAERDKLDRGWLTKLTIPATVDG